MRWRPSRQMIAYCSRRSTLQERMFDRSLKNSEYPIKQRSLGSLVPGRTCADTCKLCFHAMNDSRNHEDRLIADVFHDDWDKGAAAQFARVAATTARKRRTRRQTVIASTTSAAMLAAAVIAFYPRTRPAQPLPASKHQPNPARNYEIISDAELLATMRDRSVVMVTRSNGSGEFVLVGQ